jgi:murein L,D-transpeptidase YafK
MKECFMMKTLPAAQSTPLEFRATRPIKARIIRILTGLLIFVAFPCLANNEIDLVRVLKSERKLILLSEGKIRREFRIALSSNSVGPKQQEDDQRTPEGRYILDYRVRNSGFHKALHVSYPNTEDTEAAVEAGQSPGGQILIHGQPNGFGWLAFLNQRFDWTDGSIALNNRDMDVVWRLVKPGTPIDLLP